MYIKPIRGVWEVRKYLQHSLMFSFSVDSAARYVTALLLHVEPLQNSVLYEFLETEYSSPTSSLEKTPLLMY